MSRNVCCMQSCRNTKHEFPNLSFHNFPTKETQRCQKWVQFCDNQSIWRLFETNDPKLEHKSICSQHFHDNSYNNPMKKIRLMCNALPTIKANTKKKSTVTDTTAIKPPEPIVVSAQLLLRTNLSRNCRTNRPQNSSSLSTTTDNRENTSNVTKSNDENVMSLDNQIVSTRKTNPITNHFSTQHTKYETEIKSLKDKLKKCKKQVMNLRYRLKRTEAIGNSQKSKLNYILKNIKSLNEEELNPVLSEIIQSNLSNAFIAKSRSQKWSNSMKKFCSDIYHKSPSAYSLLQKTMTLPTKKTINKFSEDNKQMKNKCETTTQIAYNTNVDQIIDKFSEQQDINSEPINTISSDNTITIDYTVY